MAGGDRVMYRLGNLLRVTPRSLGAEVLNTFASVAAMLLLMLAMLNRWANAPLHQDSVRHICISVYTVCNGSDITDPYLEQQERTNLYERLLMEEQRQLADKH